MGQKLPREDPPSLYYHHVWHEADSNTVTTLASEIDLNSIAPGLSVASIATSRRDSLVDAKVLFEDT